MSWIYGTLGETYYALGEWHKGIESFQHSLNLAEQAGLRRATSRVYSTLGDIHRIRGRWTKADECYQHAVSAITATESGQSFFVLNLSLSVINMERKRYAKVQESFFKCWATATEGIGFTGRMASARARMGELAVRTGSLDKATEHVDEAIRLAIEAAARAELAHATMVKGLIATKRGEWDRALERYGDAQQIFQELSDQYSLGRVLSAIGSMYLRRDQSSEDRRCAQECISGASAILTGFGGRERARQAARGPDHSESLLRLQRTLAET